MADAGREMKELIELPSKILAFHKYYKECWKRMDVFRESTKPAAHAYIDFEKLWEEGAWVFGARKFEELGEDLSDIWRVAMFAAMLGAWRPTQDIITFPDELYEALIKSDFNPDMPAEAITHFPAWALYFPTPHDFEENLQEGTVLWKGFFVMRDANRAKLNFMFINNDFDDMGVTCRNRSVEIVCENDFSSMRTDIEKGETRNIREFGDLHPNLSRALSLLFYVCANGFEDRPGALERAVTYPSSRKTKKGWRVFPTDRPTVRLLGVDTAVRLEKARRICLERGTGVRPHMRRAHWHGYWLGSKNGTRKFDMRWLPPILVNGGTKLPEAQDVKKA